MHQEECFDDFYQPSAKVSASNTFQISDMQDQMTSLSQVQIVPQDRLSASLDEPLLSISDLQDLQTQHNELLSTEYLKSQNTRFNNQMYFKRLRKIDSKVRSYLDSAHIQAARRTKNIDLISFTNTKEELSDLLIQVHDINVNHVFDQKIKKKFNIHADFIQDCLLDEERARLEYEIEKEARRNKGERFLEDIKTESILQAVDIPEMMIQLRELEIVERFRPLNPALEKFRQTRAIKIQRQVEQTKDQEKYENYFHYIEIVWMSKNNKLSFIQIQDPTGLDLNFTKTVRTNDQRVKEQKIKWSNIT